MVLVIEDLSLFGLTQDNVTIRLLTLSAHAVNVNFTLNTVGAII